MKRGLQKFFPEYLAQCKKMSPVEILKFIEDFRNLVLSKKSKTKLISIKIEEDLLISFKKRCELHNLKYQRQIKNLMRKWLV